MIGLSFLATISCNRCSTSPNPVQNCLKPAAIFFDIGDFWLLRVLSLGDVISVAIKAYTPSNGSPSTGWGMCMHPNLVSCSSDDSVKAQRHLLRLVRMSYSERPIYMYMSFVEDGDIPPRVGDVHTSWPMFGSTSIKEVP